MATNQFRCRCACGAIAPPGSGELRQVAENKWEVRSCPECQYAPSLCPSCGLCYQPHLMVDGQCVDCVKATT